MSKEITTMKEQNMQQVTAAQKVVKGVVKGFTYAFLILMALIVLFPFYWMIISSLKTLEEYRLSVPTFWPQTIMLSNYAEAFTTANLGSLFQNTLYVGVVSTLLSLVITVLCAFAFARLEFKGRDALFGLLLATMMIPGELFTITNYATVKVFLNWGNTFTALIVPFLVSVFYIYLLRQNFLQIPNELYLAAKVDGTSDMKYLLELADLNNFTWADGSKPLNLLSVWYDHESDTYLCFKHNTIYYGNMYDDKCPGNIITLDRFKREWLE